MSWSRAFHIPIPLPDGRVRIVLVSTPAALASPYPVDPAFPFRNNLLKGVGLMQSGI